MNEMHDFDDRASYGAADTGAMDDGPALSRRRVLRRIHGDICGLSREPARESMVGGDAASNRIEFERLVRLEGAGDATLIGWTIVCPRWSRGGEVLGALGTSPSEVQICNGTATLSIPMTFIEIPKATASSNNALA